MLGLFSDPRCGFLICMVAKSFDVSESALFNLIASRDSAVAESDKSNFFDAALQVAAGLSKGVMQRDLSPVDARELASGFSIHRTALQLLGAAELLQLNIRRHIFGETGLSPRLSSTTIPTPTDTTFPLSRDQLLTPEMLDLIPDVKRLHGSERIAGGETVSWNLISISNGPWYAMRETESGSYLVLGEALAINREFYLKILDKYLPES